MSQLNRAPEPFDVVSVRQEGWLAPFISVVIPVYNGAAWISETIRSVCAQNRERVSFEIIVVDDGSTDGSAEAARKALETESCESRIVCVCNGGPSRARNIGWHAARGRWIQFLDADDLLHPRKLEQQAALASIADPSVAVLYSDWSRIELRDGVWKEHPARCSPRVSQNTLESLIRSENFLQLGCTLIRKLWLERVGGFHEQQLLIEDVNLLIRIALEGGTFVHVPTDFPAVHYRQYPTSLSRQHNDLFADGCWRNAKLLERHWRETTCLTPARRALLGQIYLFAAQATAGGDRPDREKLSEVARLVLPAIARSKEARRALIRALAYRYLGQTLGYSCERAYLRAVQPIRYWSSGRKKIKGSSTVGPQAAKA